MFSETEEGGGDSAFLLSSPSSMQKLPNIKEERKKVKKKKLERILKEQVFSARRYRCSTSSTQRKRVQREAQRVCACPLSRFDYLI